jgi:hypothetical protein
MKVRTGGGAGLGAARRGASYVEVQVAFTVLGMALAGLAPIVVTQLRLMARIEADSGLWTTHYLEPAGEPWARKLGAAAAVKDAPGVLQDEPGGVAVNAVTIESPPVLGPGDAIRVVVVVTPVDPP